MCVSYLEEDGSGFVSFRFVPTFFFLFFLIWKVRERERESFVDHVAWIGISRYKITKWPV